MQNVRDEVELSAAISSVIATKQFGYEKKLSDLVTKACLITFPPATSTKAAKLNIDSVRISKLRGGSVELSTVVKGMVILRDTEGIIKSAKDAKVVVFGCGFEASATEAKATVLIKNAEELMSYNKSEEKKIEEIVASIAATGVSVVIVNGTISEMAAHFLDKFNLLYLKIASKFDLRRICQALGATPVVRLGPCTPEEMGFCSK